jgi:P-type Cu2+ transporter
MSAHAAWAHPQLAAQVLRSRHDGHSEVALRVAALDDARRVLRLEQMLHALPGVQRVAIDRRAQRVRVVWDAQRTTLPRLLETFAAAHCPAQPLHHDSIDDARAVEMHDALKRLLVAGMCAMQVMTYAFVIYIGVVDFVDFSTRNLFRWLGLVTTVPLVLYSAQPFFAGAVRELRRHRLGINVPVALAVALVFLASTLNTLRGSGEIYFDSVSMFVFLLLLGRYIEMRARHGSTALGDATMDAAPLLADRLGDDGRVETVAAIALLAGDRVLVAEGSIVPADGVLESLEVQVDEARLTGESRPLTRRRGDRLVAGCILLRGPARLRVEHTGEQTTAARLGELTRHARQHRGRVAQDNHREVSRFVLRVLLLVSLTAAGWLLIDPATAFEAAVSVLVVACPCAYALTPPATRTRAFGALARRGVLVTGSEALATLPMVDYVLLDKTGTLTVPHLCVDAITPLRGGSREEMLRLAAALARESSHPLARALTLEAAGLDDIPGARNVRVIAGRGIVGEVDGRILRLGHPSFAMEECAGQRSADMQDTLVLADAAGALARFPLDEHLREGALAMVDHLRAAGIRLVIASGDEDTRVSAAARQLGIDAWHARQSPADKLALLQKAREEARVTLAIGDGCNDAPVLAGADVSAALASGTDAAQAQADLLLVNGRLDGLNDALTIATQMRQIAASSRHGALIYNLCAVPFAALGVVPPWLAAIGMSASSLAVILNAMRVGRATEPFPEAHPG